jgi:hypothetical protein
MVLWIAAWRYAKLSKNLRPEGSGQHARYFRDSTNAMQGFVPGSAQVEAAS